MPADQTVSLESSASKLMLKGGKSRFTLQTLPADDFPLVQEAADFGPVFSVPQKTLKDLLEPGVTSRWRCTTSATTSTASCSSPKASS